MQRTGNIFLNPCFLLFGFLSSSYLGYTEKQADLGRILRLIKLTRLRERKVVLFFPTRLYPEVPGLFSEIRT